MENQLKEAIRLRTEGRLDDAMRVLAELLEQYPSDAKIHYQLAWTLDRMGQEEEAIPHYEKAIALELPQEELKGALIGLGSSYRCIGKYKEAIAIFERGAKEFSECRVMKTFLAMSLYNVGAPSQSMAILLKQLSETSSDPSIQEYKEAILFYSDKLEQKWI